jgi:hypothetical protein
MGHIAICWQQNMRDYLYFMFYLEYLQSAISKLPQDEKDAYCVNGKLYGAVGLYTGLTRDNSYSLVVVDEKVNNNHAA